MNKKKLLALLLACVLFVCPLWSCGGDGGDVVDGGGLNDDGTVNWEEVDFKGTTLKYAISVNQNAEVTYGPSNVYIEGPDSTTTDEVLKKVKARNTKVEGDLNIKIEYDHIDEWYDGVFDDLKMKVTGSSSDAPDLYNNDTYGLNRALIAGYLMNVADPVGAKGEELDSYFDFDYEGWNYDFMSGATLDSSKVYLLVGDYHLDVIRMAWVLYVNKTMFNQNATSLGLGASEIADFYRYVLAGVWDYDMMADLCRKIWQDNGTSKDRTDAEDGRVGLAINHVSMGIFASSTCLTTFQLDEDGKATVIDDINDFNIMAGKARQIQDASKTGDGIYYEFDVLSSTDHFMGGNFLFAHSVMGELESDEMRDVSFEKGLVPLPKYSQERQEDYHTMVHDQAEVTAILVTVQNFSCASAFMQYANEASREVLEEYYEFSLKFKYNEDPAIRKMIDLVYDSIDKPFGMQFQNIILEYAPEGVTGLGAGIATNTVSSIFDANRSAYRAALDKALEGFSKVP